MLIIAFHIHIFRLHLTGTKFIYRIIKTFVKHSFTLSHLARDGNGIQKKLIILLSGMGLTLVKIYGPTVLYISNGPIKPSKEDRKGLERIGRRPGDAKC